MQRGCKCINLRSPKCKMLQSSIYLSKLLNLGHEISGMLPKSRRIDLTLKKLKYNKLVPTNTCTKTEVQNIVCVRSSTIAKIKKTGRHVFIKLSINRGLRVRFRNAMLHKVKAFFFIFYFFPRHVHLQGREQNLLLN